MYKYAVVMYKKDGMFNYSEYGNNLYNVIKKQGEVDNMAKYIVTYSESYSRDYEVEANSKEEAEEIVKEDISEGRRPAPDDCYDWGCVVTEIREGNL